jgi:hypothetical protein
LGYIQGFLPQTRPHPDTSVVGRFLRKRRSGEHDIEAPVSLASTLDGQHHRAGPLGDRSLPRRSLGYIQSFYHKLGLTVG